MKYFLIYLILVNLIGFILMGIDKSKAKKNQWRISEKTLFISAAIGGSLGVSVGMKHFHHKTKHKRFVYGIPAIIAVQAAAALYVYYNFF